MSKLLASLILVFTLSACAHGPAHYGHSRHYNGYNNGGNWITPLVIGGVIGYAARPYIYPQPTYEPQQSNSVITINGVQYIQDTQYFADCNCYRQILIRP